MSCLLLGLCTGVWCCATLSGGNIGVTDVGRSLATRLFRGRHDGRRGSRAGSGVARGRSTGSPGRHCRIGRRARRVVGRIRRRGRGAARGGCGKDTATSTHGCNSECGSQFADIHVVLQGSLSGLTYSQLVCLTNPLGIEAGVQSGIKAGVQIRAPRIR